MFNENCGRRSALHEADPGCTVDGRVLDPAVSSPRVATVAGRIVTRRSGIQIALLAVLPIFSRRDKRGISVTSGQATTGPGSLSFKCVRLFGLFSRFCPSLANWVNCLSDANSSFYRSCYILRNVSGGRRRYERLRRFIKVFIV